MASRLERDHERSVPSGTRQIAITTIGAALLVIGSAIAGVSWLGLTNRYI